jgi:glycerol-3-phosphate dehydrogenase
VAMFPSDHSDERRLSGAAHYSFREIDWIARNESVVHLSDIVLRRTTVAIEGQLTYEGLVDIAGITAKALGWDAPLVAYEINDVVSLLKAFHGQTLAAGRPDIEPGKSARPLSR